MSILDYREMEKLYSALRRTGIDYIRARPLMFQGLPILYRGILHEYSVPEFQMRGDGNRMNDDVRLADGSVPLAIWLMNAIALSGGRDAINDLASTVALVESRTGGAPTVDTTDLPEIKEEIVHQNDMVPLAFMHDGLRAASAVARLAVKRFDNGVAHFTNASPTLYLGTGFLVTPSLLVTNHHVINARNADEAAASEDDLRQQAGGSVARFGYDAEGIAGHELQIETLCAWSKILDYAVLRVPAIHQCDPVDLSFTGVVLQTQGNAMAVNIIQHPGGRPKQYAIRNNLVSGTTETDIRYFTDTTGGSSGSPVFDDRWRLVALHRGATVAKNVRFQGRATAFLNVGTKWSEIVADLRQNSPTLASEILPTSQ